MSKHQPVLEKSDNPAYAAGTYISDVLSTHVDQPILLLLAGGSSRKVLPYINPEYLTKHITVTVTDERFTDDMSENNFDVLQTMKFYEDLTSVDAYCINTSVVGGNIAYEEHSKQEGVKLHASQFSNHIEEWLKEFPSGIIVGLFGMGPDGHIAGIIPGIYKGDEFDAKFLGTSLVEVVEDNRSDAAHPIRVSVTMSLMKRIHYPILFLEGENKKPALEKALNEETAYEEIPARIILDMKTPVIFTDIAL